MHARATTAPCDGPSASRRRGDIIVRHSVKTALKLRLTAAGLRARNKVAKPCGTDDTCGAQMKKALSVGRSNGGATEKQ
jgi:hypothetical protein